MKGSTVLIIGAGGLALVVVVLLLKKKPAPVANAGLPINSAPARAFSLGSLFSSLGQPNNPIFTPASGVAFLEGALSGGSSPSAALSSPDSSYYSGSGGTGDGGSGFDVGDDGSMDEGF